MRAEADPFLVAASVMIAVMASYVVLELAERLSESQGRQRWFWLSGGMLAMGLGIWSMHLTGLRSFNPSTPVVLDPRLALLALLIPIGASGLALLLVGQEAMTIRQWLGAGLLIGLAIVSDFVVSMAALRSPVVVGYNLTSLATAALIALAASLLALWLAFCLHLGPRSLDSWRRFVGAVALGGGIAGMHFVGLKAVSLAPRPAPSGALTVSITDLGAASIGAGAFFILAIALMSAYKERLHSRLTRQKEFIETLLSSAGESILAVDEQGRATYVNRAVTAMLGFTPEEVLGHNAHAMIHHHRPDGSPYPESECAIMTPLRDHTTHEGQEVLWRKDGSPMPVEYVSAPFTLESGKRGQVTLFSDISERLRAQEALGRLAAIVESSSDAIMSLDPTTFHIMTWNRGAEAMFGYTPEEVIGQPIKILTPRVRSSEADAIIEQLRQGKTVPPYETVRFTKAGKLIDVGVSLFAVQDPQGCLMSFSAIMHDITERKRTLEEIALRTAELQKSEELNRLKDHFLSTLSHEMKTPLSLITGYAELLEDKYPGETLLQGIEDGSRRLTDHINSMLDYSALISGTLPLYKTEVVLPEVLEAVLAQLEPGLRLSGLTPRIEIAPDTPPIEADPRRVMQMLVELLENARKFTPSGGEVGVCLGPHQDGVRIQVWDTGKGIPDHSYDHIWEAFTQLDTGDAARKGGLGLGLTIVKKLVELHGGGISVQSEPNKGSRFIIDLPAQCEVCIPLENGVRSPRKPPQAPVAGTPPPRPSSEA